MSSPEGDTKIKGKTFTYGNYEFLNSLSNNIKNVFVGSHKGENISDKWFNTPHPHDSMPIANGTNRYKTRKISRVRIYV